MNKQLSIVVPVYNVEKYIRPFFESIFRQGLPEECYEIIVVNDGTPDHSMEQVTDLLNQHDNVTIIDQENQGVSVARNNALARATGEYVLMLDPDDLLIDGSLPILLEKAIASKVDAIVADFIMMQDEEIAVLDSSPVQPVIEWKEKTGKQLFLEDLSPYECFVWCTLYRREFLQKHHLKFIPGIFVQDVPFTHECYLRIKKCLRTNLLLNIYRRWSGQATGKFTMKHVKSFSIALSKTWSLRKSVEDISPEEHKKLQSDVFISFYFLMLSILSNFPSTSERLRAIDYLKQNASDLSFSNGKNQKCITFLYRLSPRLLLFLWALRLRIKTLERIKNA